MKIKLVMFTAVIISCLVFAAMGNQQAVASSDGTLAADINDDDIVNLGDLSKLSTRWLDVSRIHSPRIWYKFDEASDTVVTDSSGNDLHAGFNSGANPLWDQTGGYDGSGCIIFDGTYRIYKYIADFLGPDAVEGQITVALWLKGDQPMLVSGGRPFSITSQSTDMVTHLRAACPDGTGNIWCQSPSSQPTWSGSIPAEWMGDWNHYAFVKDASTGLLSIYCNGFLTAQSTNDFSPLDPPIKQLLIGTANYANYYFGRIDDFRIYNFALTQEEVISLPGVSDVAQDLLDRADITGDGRVGLPDFAVVAEQWMDTTGPPQSGNTYYVDGVLGKDSNNGLSEDKPWETLAKVNSRVFSPGDKVLFKADTSYLGQLKLAGGGEEGNPAIVDMYGDGNKPLIDGDGYLAALLIEDVQYWEVSNLEIINDGATAKQPEAVDERYGVHIKAYNTGTRNHLYLRNLDVHHIFSETNETGRGIALESGGYVLKTNYNDVLIENCKVSITGNTGIWLHHKVWAKTSPYFAYNTNIIIRDNYLVDVGGPGFQPNHCKNVLLENNVVDGSGASVEPRQKGRGSGIWPWKCEDVTIQNNLFMHARGIGDSCGAHVDVGNINTTIQYNLSYDNAGGFVEILGNCYNTIYRYNVSINDGWRIKGVDGAFQHGHMFWLGGWTGEDNPKQGPYDSKIYNNTVYLASSIQTQINVDDSAEDAFFTNNLIYIDGTVLDYNPDSTAVNIIFDNNLHNIALPATLPQTNAIIADPSLINPGGITTYDYRISAASVAIDNGVTIPDSGGRDYWGMPIDAGGTDIGAFEFFE